MSYPIPKTGLDDRLAFVGNTGGGKTYSAGTAVERLLSMKARVVIIDPLGVWYGLALDADGKAPSRFRTSESLIVFGGPRGDLPLNEHAGALIGEAVAGMKESAILDFSDIGTKAGERRFALAFLTALYRFKTREPLHLIFDEADLFAPQRILDKEGEAMKLLGMMETVVRRGRVKGFIPWLITQRPAVLSKNVLSQADGLVAFKLTSVQDRDAIGDWVEGQADKAQWRQMFGNLATMQCGQAVVWIPGRSILRTAQFPKKETYDSSRAPERGERHAKAGNLRPVNIDKLKSKLANVVAEAKANDPKALKAEIMQLKGELLRRTKIKETDSADYARGKTDGYAEAVIAITKELAHMSSAVTVVETEFKVVKAAVDRAKKLTSTKIFTAKAKTTPKPIPVTTETWDRLQFGKVLHQRPVSLNGFEFTAPQTKVLQSLTMWKSLGKDTPTREMVAAAAGYKPSTGNFNNVIGSLVKTGVVAKMLPGCLSLATDTNFGLMDRKDGADMLMGILKMPERKVLDALRGKGERSREEVAADSGYHPGTGNFNNILGSLNKLCVIYKPSPGMVAMTDWAEELLQ